MSVKRHNLHMLEIVASGLGDLLGDTVFVGGANTTLYVSGEVQESDSAVRPTDDVDCVMEVANRAEYARMEKKLRGLGFKHVTEIGAPACRWTYLRVTVDIMPPFRRSRFTPRDSTVGVTRLRPQISAISQFQGVR